MKKLSAKQFREEGYLQEVNRLFLHPLGLALEVIVDHDCERFGDVWDSRDDSEGLIFEFDNITEAKQNAEKVSHEYMKRKQARIKLLGQIVQPIK